MAVYYVWDSEGIYKTSVEATQPESAIILARMSHGIKAAMVQEEFAFIELHQIKDKLTLEHARTRQNLRFADIKNSENRTWRDRKYAQ